MGDTTETRNRISKPSEPSNADADYLDTRMEKNIPKKTIDGADFFVAAREGESQRCVGSHGGVSFARRRWQQSPRTASVAQSRGGPSSQVLRRLREGLITLLPKAQGPSDHPVTQGGVCMGGGGRGGAGFQKKIIGVLITERSSSLPIHPPPQG